MGGKFDAHDLKTGVSAGRLDAQAYPDNFTDLHPPLSPNRVHIEAGRCYFCYEAPCVQACPTGIDIPLFIGQIATANPGGAAGTIYSSNIMGGMGATVGQVPEYAGMVAKWCKAHTNIPVIVKLTPNITDIGQPAGAVHENGRCHIACEDTSHQAITFMVNGERKFEVNDEECVGYNLCVNVCPEEGCITLEQMTSGSDPRRPER